MPELVLIFDTVTGNYILKTVAASHLADGAVVSGKIAAGAVISGAIASGQVGAAHLGAASVLSAHHASGSVGAPHHAAGSVLSAHVAAGAIATPHIAAGGVLSGAYGAGSIAGPHMADGGVVSGKIAAGSIAEDRLASGISIDISETSQEPTFRADAAVGAFQAVRFSLSGFFGLARAHSGFQPAVGIAAAAAASGAVGTFQTLGRVTNTGWNFSGFVGRPLFLGTSSEVVTASPSASGEFVQRLGQVVSPVGALLYPDVFLAQVGA